MGQRGVLLAKGPDKVLHAGVVIGTIEIGDTGLDESPHPVDRDILGDRRAMLDRELPIAAGESRHGKPARKAYLFWGPCHHATLWAGSRCANCGPI